MQGGSPTGSVLLNLIDGALGVEPRYLYLHHNMMQANCH